MTSSLEELRAEIDRLDDQIIPLLNQRARLAVEIGRIKKARGDALYVPARERHVLDRLMAQNAGPLSHVAVCRIYREVMAAALALERHARIFAGGASDPELGRAVAYLAGGDAEVTILSDASELAASFGADPESIMLLAEPWEAHVRARLHEMPARIRWAACWFMPGPDGGKPVRYHAYRHAGASADVAGPAACYALYACPPGAHGAPPDWLARLPVRHCEWLPLGRTGGEEGLLRITFDCGTEEAMAEWGGLLREQCRMVWVQSSGAL